MPEIVGRHGRAIAWTEAGPAVGRTVVLVHGAPADSRAWGRVVRHLHPEVRAVIPDLPGCGASAALPPGPSASTLAVAASVVDVIARQADPVWLAGHSYGGNVALHAALACPDRVRGLLLLEPVFFRGLTLAGQHAERAPAETHFRDYIARMNRGEHEAVDRMIDFWFGAGAYARLPAHVRSYLVQEAPRSGEFVGHALDEVTEARALAGLAMPVSVVTGGASPPVVAAIARSIAALAPDVRIATLEGATHGMLDTHPQAVAACIARLLDG